MIGETGATNEEVQADYAGNSLEMLRKGCWNPKRRWG